MSFSSPLYWQLKYIVQDCFSAASTKSTAHEVEEIEQLTNLYGDDADTFLLQSLLNTVRKTDLNHIKGQKAALIFFARKIDTLAASRSNFSNIFCESILFDQDNDVSPTVDKAFLDSFCSTFGLVTCTRVAIGVSLSLSAQGKSINEVGRDFLLSCVGDVDSWVHAAPAATAAPPVYGAPPLKLVPSSHARSHPTSSGQPPPSLTVTPLTVNDFEPSWPSANLQRSKIAGIELSATTAAWR